MTNWKKRLVVGLMWPAALLAGFALAAPAAEEQERSIVLSYWAQTESPALDLVYYRMCREYEDANPDVKINLNMVSSNSDVFLKTMDDAKKGAQPEADVAMLTLFALGDRAAKGEVLNLDSRVLEWADRSDFSPSVLGLGRYRGALVGIGYYPTPELFVYRKDYFKEAGLDPDNPPKTWEEIAAAAEKLTKRDASGKVIRAGFDIPAQSAHINHLESFMRQNGAKIIDPITEAIDINGVAAVAAANWMIALKNKNTSIPFSIAKYDVPFLRGDSAMSQVKTMDIAAMFKADPGMRDKVGFMHVPVRKAPGAFTGYKLLSVMKQSKQPDEAWKFLQFVMSKENVWKRYKAYGIVPVRKSLQAQYIAEEPVLNRYNLEYVDLGVGKPVVGFTTNFYKLAGAAWEKMYKGEMLPAAALQEVYDQQMKELAK
jgi:ABC-type glycerol-3-phosphate transport system substrate-binding protein